MPKQSDPEDQGFVEAMTALSGLDAEQINDLLGGLDATSMIELADAVGRGAASRVKAIVRHNHDLIQGNPATPAAKPPTAPAPPAAPAASQAPAPANTDTAPAPDTAGHSAPATKAAGATVQIADESADPPHVLAIGDNVEIDGKDATVSIPVGPHGSVGIMAGGKLKMVNRKDVTIKENAVLGSSGVMGLSGIGDLMRIRQLAGLSTEAAAATSDDACASVQVALAEPAPPEDPVHTVMAALDQLAQALPNVRLGDCKEIKGRLSGLMASLQERATPRLPRGPKRV